jgi:hypothetical protein
MLYRLKHQNRELRPTDSEEPYQYGPLQGAVKFNSNH